jgi:hypothetical protein
MQDSEVRPGERVKAVQFTEDTLAVGLVDGRTIIVPLVWIQGFSTLPLNSFEPGKSAVLVSVSISIGRISTKI